MGLVEIRRSLGNQTRARVGGDNRQAAKRRDINKGNEAACGGLDGNSIACPSMEEEEEEEEEDRE